MRGFFWLLLLCIIHIPAYAAPRLLLDTELQTWLDGQAAPLMRAAQLEPSAVSFHVLIDDEINAFATPDNRIFVNTGLILRADGPQEVQGVLAHELGHILSRHGFQRHQDIRNNTFATIAGAVVGIGAAIAGAGGDAALAGLLGGRAVGAGNALSHSRTQEREADQHGVTLLHRAQLDASGMLTFFKKLNNDQLLSYKAPPAHLLTHPLTAERLDSLRFQVSKQSADLHQPGPTEQEAFLRVQAKAYAFSHTPMQTLRKYRGTRPADRLAQVLAYLYQGKMDEASTSLAPLQQAEPANPFVLELQGHIAMEREEFPQALAFFQQALRHNPDRPILRFHLATAYQANKDDKNAIEQLEHIRAKSLSWPGVFYALGISYGRLKQFGQSHLNLAENALLRQELPLARKHLELAKPHLPARGALQSRYQLLQLELDRAEEKTS